MGLICRLSPVPVTVVRDLTSARAELERGRWDVVLVDVHLDGELGTDLLEDPAAMRQSSLVFMSGGAPGADLMARIRRGGFRLLEKPFSPAAVWDLSEEGKEPALR